jgi:hypothetical protein
MENINIYEKFERKMKQNKLTIYFDTEEDLRAIDEFDKEIEREYRMLKNALHASEQAAGASILTC